MIESNAHRARLIIAELVRCGVDEFIIAPGFRSAPLALAAISHPGTHCTVHFDERGSAFFALGYGRASRKPCVWITTSGTAAANGLPAIVEASMERVPMICLTADRPPELRDTGANQTIDQVHLFGRYPRWFVDLPAPASEQEGAFIRTTIDQAVHRACAGPVHLNCMFREPLLEEDRVEESIPETSWSTEERQLTQYMTASEGIAAPSRRLVQSICEAHQGLIVVGSLQDPEDGKAIHALAKHLGWPLMADICAPGPAVENTVTFFDLIVRSEWFTRQYPPDVVLHFGGPLVSKKLQQFLSHACADTYALIAPSSDRIDPHHVLTDRIQSKIAGFCNCLLSEVPRDKSHAAWTEVWRRANTIARRTLVSLIDQELSEPSVAWMLSRLFDHTNWIFGASSMPIRDLQAFLERDTSPRIFANRGASGIDGTLATAAGIARGQSGSGTVLLGDLAMLHDLNSLALLKDFDITIVVINNNGGGIFNMLPIALEQEPFEMVLGTPHGMDFRFAAEQFQIPYTLVDSCAQFQESWQAAAASPGPNLIEVKTDRRKNADLHEAIYRRVSEAIEAELLT
ncbi:MAG: 2-succinyl-5-enolpyruvyl-6-hydroxy-3-cyclohexene-1-carboxylic-acid synthase [Rhodothermaceae bacterium]|nr:2-succinyl-5-enolpyruvyl-6-hydroxy-3-cyclohexene-1-carboxylic-acid synthase [Rhodothermaceae bacterium]MYI84958.1 2-succinyl-5-enolpyruvyl-6-hydroxy-3-cyclohexene-1-carboxylic-acid synthase [Rhodothermaceae bacterium]